MVLYLTKTTDNSNPHQYALWCLKTFSPRQLANILLQAANVPVLTVLFIMRSTIYLIDACCPDESGQASLHNDG